MLNMCLSVCLCRIRQAEVRLWQIEIPHTSSAQPRSRKYWRQICCASATKPHFFPGLAFCPFERTFRYIHATSATIHWTTSHHNKTPGSPTIIFPNSDSYLMSTPGCTRSDYQPVHTQVRYRLPSYFEVNEVFREKARVQQRIAYEVKSIAACNSCIAKIQAIRTESPACEFLIDSLFLRDPLEMLLEYLSGRVCKSKCKAMFDLTLHSALEVCSTDWHQRWTSTSYHAILSKQLVMMAAMRYAIHSSALFKQELQRKRSTATSSLCWL